MERLEHGVRLDVDRGLRLEADGLSPSSGSALRSFENSLVTANASGTTLAGNTTLLSQFEAQHGKLWTPAPLLKQLAEEGRKFADFVRGAAQARGGDA